MKISPKELPGWRDREPPGDSYHCSPLFTPNWSTSSEEWTAQLPNAPPPGPTTQLSQMLRRVAAQEGKREHFLLDPGMMEGDSNGKRAQEWRTKGQHRAGLWLKVAWGKGAEFVEASKLFQQLTLQFLCKHWVEEERGYFGCFCQFENLYLLSI